MLVRLPAAGLLAVFMLAGCGRADARRRAPLHPPLPASAGRNSPTPAKKAFAVEVPQGWSVRGGMFRMGFSDARAMVDMTSPDGRINVRLGDVSVPSYVLPGPYHERAGEIYDLGAQAQMVVARYHSGPEFATLYSHARFHELCRNPQGDPNPSGLALPDFVPSPVRPDQTSSGQITYRCDAAQRGAVGGAVAFAWARTSLYQTIWGVTPLVSFFAPASEVQVARAVLLRRCPDTGLNPQWIQYQKHMDSQGLEYQRARQQQRMAALSQQVRQFERRCRPCGSRSNRSSAIRRRRRPRSKASATC